MNKKDAYQLQNWISSGEGVTKKKKKQIWQKANRLNKSKMYDLIQGDVLHIVFFTFT